MWVTHPARTYPSFICMKQQWFSLLPPWIGCQSNARLSCPQHYVRLPWQFTGIHLYWAERGTMKVKGVSFKRDCGDASLGEYNRVIKYYQLSWYHKLASIMSFKADFSSISPLKKRTMRVTHLTQKKQHFDLASFKPRPLDSQVQPFNQWGILFSIFRPFTQMIINSPPWSDSQDAVNIKIHSLCFTLLGRTRCTINKLRFIPKNKP